MLSLYMILLKDLESEAAKKATHVPVQDSTVCPADWVPVMKTDIPYAHILKGKTCFNHKENLLSLQESC